MGCAALVLDFSKNTHWWIEAGFGSLIDDLKQLPCDVDSAEPDFWVYDTWAVVGIRGHNLTYSTSPEQKLAAAQHNNKEWFKVGAAIAAHDRKVASGKEIDMEFVHAHGSPGAPGGHTWSAPACGYWTTDFNTGPLDGLQRSDFHTHNYTAAKRHVCDWLTWDGSCFAGQTPMAVDELENGQFAMCTQPSIVTCPLHAGYEMDDSGGAQIATKVLHQGFFIWRSVQLDLIIQGARDRNALRQLQGKPPDYDFLKKKFDKWLPGKGVQYTIEGGSNAAYYLDKGYHGDQPPPSEHPHEGY
jgi:hypothetical protein